MRVDGVVQLPGLGARRQLLGAPEVDPHAGDGQGQDQQRRDDDRQYGDGVSVTKEQFVETRRAEMRDNRRAVQEQKFQEGLDPKQAKRFERFASALDLLLQSARFFAGKHMTPDEARRAFESAMASLSALLAEPDGAR